MVLGRKIRFPLIKKVPSMAESRGQWSGGLGFIMAVTGSAIGLGNLWKFPYITHENHGGAFVLV